MNKFNRLALVTGGAQGIGLAISHALITHHYHVVIIDLHEPKPFQQNHPDKEHSLLLHFKKCDLSQTEQIHSTLTAIKEELGSIDILINNAGIVSQGTLTEISDTTWQKVFNINVNGPFKLAKAVLPSMQEKRWGRIINIASVAAQTGGGFLGNTCYAASKGAILALTKGIAREYAKYNITCNAICPGYVATPLTATMPKKQVEESLKTIPAGRPASPEEIANAVIFLASDKSGYINGVTLNVDGGLIRY